LDFNPGDELIMADYLKQNKFSEAIKKKYQSKTKLHDFVNTYMEKQEKERDAEIEKNQKNGDTSELTTPFVNKDLVI